MSFYQARRSDAGPLLQREGGLLHVPGVCAKLTSLVQEKPGCFTAFFLCVLGLYWDECVLYLALKGYG